MNIFRRKTLKISEKDPTYKVMYLGNVHTTMMKGEGCVDKPVSILWNNYLQNGHCGTEMKLTIQSYGMLVHTKTQGSTEYFYRYMSYCIAHPDYPKLFVWVYHHKGNKFGKVNTRCHAALCQKESKAKVMAVMLTERISLAVKEFTRMKHRQSKTRECLMRTNSCPVNGGVDGSIHPLRTRMLSTGHNFRPSSDKLKSPSLNAITEDRDGEEIVEEEEEEEAEEEVAPLGSSPSASPQYIRRRPSRESLTNLTAILEDKELDQGDNDNVVAYGEDNVDFSDDPMGDSPEGSDGGSSSDLMMDSLNLIPGTLLEFEIGNNVEELLQDAQCPKTPRG
ncbi:protein FAM43A-like isoform X2 [Tubulanus polymorphus]|uniref:protein FAM43A-like isoform X2 n=1 Tax=Tubulanus polymorphus TaxID=672921 RepID=UPI003DA40157